ncbi:bifunctional DNA primase/polymerase [Pseudonocardia dioxanivorans]|uniref:bifunctional DNA primase/polymerase n=1 Tax=Pseudonocardia dioxanivorans TaxID=240495 RepID=UPI001F38E5E1|nr:bifunctional DNA primase/polymerase [Pseudonocardia dioxanivorans]
MSDRGWRTGRGAGGRGAGGGRRLGRLGQAALELAAGGLYVFPLWPRSKKPAVENWEQEATRDPAVIAAWWSTRPFNIGVATGPSGLVVVDLDDAHGHEAPAPWAGARHGREVFALVAAAAGQPVPTDTYTVATPTGGTHLYFRAPQGLELRNSAARLGWRIDTRAAGGYIVAAPSVRAEGYYRVTHRGPVAELPEWLVEALTPPPPPAVPATPVVLPSQRAGAYVRKIVEQEAAMLAAAPVGGRHWARLAAARTLGRLVGGGALDLVEARAVLLAAAAGQVGVENTTRAEVERDIDDGLAYGARLPRRIGATR